MEQIKQEYRSMPRDQQKEPSTTQSVIVPFAAFSEWFDATRREMPSATEAWLYISNAYDTTGPLLSVGWNRPATPEEIDAERQGEISYVAGQIAHFRKSLGADGLEAALAQGIEAGASPE